MPWGCLLLGVNSIFVFARTLRELEDPPLFKPVFWTLRKVPFEEVQDVCKGGGYLCGYLGVNVYHWGQLLL